MRNEILPYNRKLKQYARNLRKKMTQSEKIIWERIRKKQIEGYEFHRQVPINNFIVDFYCHELKLALEIDGSSHDNKKEYDKERDCILEGMGVKIIRFKNEEVNNNIDEVLTAIITSIK